MVNASVTSGVAAPSGIAVSNLVQGLASTCTAGCDFFGGTTLKHKVNGGDPNKLTSNVVENLCVVGNDPRVSNGLCDGTPLQVNKVCPGFDNVDPNNPMTIPGYLCGGSGKSSSGFALIKTLTAPNEFDQTIVETATDTDILFPHATNPTCGANGTMVWAPLNGEGFIVEGVPPLSSNPTMVETTDACGTGHTVNPNMSLWGVGLALYTANLPAGPGNYADPVRNFARTKYINLKQTITDLTSTNISGPVSAELTNGTNGCIDNSLQLLNDAVDPVISPDQTTRNAFFQDAADLLTNADKNGITTCDSIVFNNLGAFTESPPGPANLSPVFNPSGQVRSRLANLYFTIETRLLNLPAPSAWPAPVTISITQQPVAVSTSVTLNWNLNGLNSPSCAWSSSDTGFVPNPANPVTFGSMSFNAPALAGDYSYTLTCNGVSATAWIIAH